MVDRALGWVAKRRGYVIASKLPPEVQRELHEADLEIEALQERLARVSAFGAAAQARKSYRKDQDGPVGYSDSR